MWIARAKPCWESLETVQNVCSEPSHSRSGGIGVFYTEIGRIMTPKYVHILLTRTCGYVVALQMGCAGVIKLRKDIEMRRLSWIIQMGPV